jgi:quaternary ammonium compound-resistance protein SugE
MNSWLWLVAAGLCEVLWAVSLKYTAGWSRPLPSVITIAGMIVSFVCLAHALKTIPIGTAYAAWTGIGILGTTLFGIFFLGEGISALRLLSIALIAAGIAGLKIGG